MEAEHNNGNGEKPLRDPKTGRLLPGARLPGAGRPKGSRSGRSKFVQLVDDLISSGAAETLIKGHLEDLMKADPDQFLQRYVMPLLPKESIQTLPGDKERAAVRIYTETGPSTNHSNDGPDE